MPDGLWLSLGTYGRLGEVKANLPKVGDMRAPAP